LAFFLVTCAIQNIASNPQLFVRKISLTRSKNGGGNSGREGQTPNDKRRFIVPIAVVLLGLGRIFWGIWRAQASFGHSLGAWLVGVQLLGGVGVGIFGVITPLVLADLMRGTGRYNVAQGSVAMPGPSTSGLGVNHFGYSAPSWNQPKSPAFRSQCLRSSCPKLRGICLALGFRNWADQSLKSERASLRAKRSNLDPSSGRPLGIASSRKAFIAMTDPRPLQKR
jgi:hypothetical protein